MFNVGGGEVLVILLIALIVLGPEKLPNAAKQAGKYLNEFRRMSNGFQQEIRNAMDLDGSSRPATPAAPAVPVAPAPTTDALADADVQADRATADGLADTSATSGTLGAAPADIAGNVPSLPPLAADLTDTIAAADVLPAPPTATGGGEPGGSAVDGAATTPSSMSVDGPSGSFS